MSTVRVGENETIESALRRFKRKCSRDGIIGDLRRKEHYEKPSVRRKKKSRSGEKKKYKRINRYLLMKFVSRYFFINCKKCRKRRGEENGK